MPKDLIGKLDTHPYGRLLAFAADRTLASNPFTKEEAAGAVNDSEFDQYVSFVCDSAGGGKYVVKFSALENYLAYADMASTRRNANIALGAAIAAIVVSIILAVVPLLQGDKPLRLTQDQFNQLVAPAQQPVKLAELPIAVKLEETQVTQIKQLCGNENSNVFVPKNKRP